MQLIESGSGQALVLPDDLMWSDEHGWTPAVASVSYLLGGALLVESAKRGGGRPITLVGPPDMAWVKREVVNQLYDWAGEPGRLFELRFRAGRFFRVGFRHQDTAIEAEPVLGFAARSDSDFYRLTLRLMEM